jgi:hypothetical protein
MATTVLDVLKERIESDKDCLETCLGYVEDLSRNLEYDDE